MLPESIGNLSELKTLSLSDNKISGPIPESIGFRMTNLTTLSFIRNNLTNSIPSSLGMLRNLSALHLDLNDFGGNIPQSLGNCTALRELTMSFNRLHGRAPDSLANLTLLEVLHVRQNLLTGSIPQWIYGLRWLRELDLASNLLTGHLSPRFREMSRLQEVRLSNNFLGGSIPFVLGGMHSLRVLHLARCRLTGTIPSSLGLLTNLTELGVLRNALTGTIPSSLGGLNQLKFLDISENRVNGAIPSSLGQLVNLKILLLYYNILSGTIPEVLGNLPQLEILDLSNNTLHGTLPSSLHDLAQLRVLSVYNNGLTGTLPSFLCDYEHLLALYLHTNEFDGTIPGCVERLTTMRYASFNANSFTGTLPQELFRLSNLSNIWLGANYMTGTIPNLDALANLTEITVNNNDLTGTVPAMLVGKQHLQLMHVGLNHLTGTIPSSIGSLPVLKLLVLNDNLLTGCIPTSFAQMKNIVEIYVQRNHLGCSLHGVVDAATQLALSVLDVSNNRITGTLPKEVFKLDSLTAFVALGNCFTGTLPAEMCDSQVVSLILDGLHTSTACRTEIPLWTNAYTIPKSFYGTVPACLLNMTTLTSLHLSGNTLSGTIPDVDSLKPRLLDLILSHNVLTGTIPTALQSHNFRTLDLSFNRLQGVLQPSFGAALQPIETRIGLFVTRNTSNAVYLQNNRLSGIVPAAMLNFPNMSMLGSNMFSCQVDKSDLPQNDNNKDSYQCGSNDFDPPIIVVAFCLFAAAVAYCCFRWRSSLAERINATLSKWHLDPLSAQRNIQHVDTASDILCQVGLYCTALIVLVLMPWYVGASHYFGTYVHQYAWVLSAAFLSGIPAFATEFVLYIALIAALVYIASVIVVKKDNEERSRSGSRTSARISQDSVKTAAVTTQIPRWKRVLIYTVFLSINLIVVVGANVGFVAIALTQSNGVLFLAQVLLSLFKLIWNTVCTPFMIHFATGFISQSRASTGLVTMQVVLGLFNNITIPCIVVAMLSPSCFYNIFAPPAPVESTFVIRVCYIQPLVVSCKFPVFRALNTSYTPPFRYSFQCSSSFITYYAAAYVYLAIAASVLTPLAKVCCLYLYPRAKEGTYWKYILGRFLPRLLKSIPPTRGSLHTAVQSADSALTENLTTIAIARRLWASYRPYFNANNHLIVLITYLGILVTFGVVFPPLALAMCATMLSVAWQKRLELGRFLYNANQIGAFDMVDHIERECRGAVSIEKLRRSVFIIICFACSFYALFLFDTLGDAVGLHKAVWVLGVMPLLPLCVYAADRVSKAHRQRSGGLALGMSVDERLFEMSAVMSPVSASCKAQQGEQGEQGEGKQEEEQSSGSRKEQPPSV